MRLSGRVLSRRRVQLAFVVAAGAVAVAPHTAAGAASGMVFGGVSAQDFPVVIETSKNGRKIVDSAIAIRLTCTSGGSVVLPDRYRNLSVSKKGKFSASFGPMTSRNDDGTTTDFEGSVSGTFNKPRTKVSGKWTFKGTDHDAAGAVTETCEAANVSWSAKQ
jgi:hypothetical protein